MNTVAPPPPPKKKSAKKKAARKTNRRKKSARGNGINIAVDYATVSIGDETARIGCKVPRDAMSLSDADRSLCGRRLHGEVILCGGDFDPDQQTLETMEDIVDSIEAVFDVKRFSVSPKHIGFGLAFSLQEIEVEQLARFAKKRGRVVVQEIRNLDEIEKDED